MAAVAPTEYKWHVRKGNTARLTVQYRDLSGAIIDTTGVTATLFVYDSGLAALTKPVTNTPATGTFEIFLSDVEILDFDFRQAEYEMMVVFPNGDIVTLIDGPLVVDSGRGPFE
jgi:hypothetical protein